MPESNIAIEVKSDLEYIYKLTGDLLNDIEAAETDHHHGMSGKLLDRVKQCLADTSTVIQKDIYNCDFIISGAAIKEEQRKYGRKEE